MPTPRPWWQASRHSPAWPTPGCGSTTRAWTARLPRTRGRAVRCWPRPRPIWCRRPTTTRPPEDPGKKYLRALENEEWGLLPGPTFVRSFLRTYGDYLDIDGRMLKGSFGVLFADRVGVGGLVGARQGRD